ncbi:autotransporter outer membrane beta-barrel domain-containing protein [Budviciaceae bacterium BWR-B9]|uniref:Autotransporter outer membrane beta-barrel domain-containing protein n=1 Tax=Limnobaculum allomyrinae TaxID=2791986 RepID=A0ABS1IN08_9GAMM|nr:MULTISPECIES: autotransporter outer membrane beta-barrel domain-containing protein [Limnobaculum]MBK5143128.1 autotransporter outer membrane beta-barrel domain-containing protein [Limnobaculum allomyrinae]MBV7691017.1 autotransporter outer membrane beta-barrel domain-containing protein [Limnobaculum sp. M2-1]
MSVYSKCFLLISAVVPASISYSVNAAPPYYNESGTASSGLWDWENKGNVIGGDDGNRGELILQGSASYNNMFSVGYNGGNGALTIKDNATHTGETTRFYVGFVSNTQPRTEDTVGVLNLIGSGIGHIDTSVLRIGDTSEYDRYTVRDKAVTGTLNILDGASVNVGPVSGTPGSVSGGVMWVGNGNAVNTGTVNVSGANSKLSLINKVFESSPYVEDYIVNGDAYLGYYGDANINISDGGSLTTGRMIASFAKYNDVINSGEKTSTVNINVTGAESKLAIQSLLALASSEGGEVYGIDFYANIKGVGTAILTVEDGAEVYFEGKAYADGYGFPEKTSGLFLASDAGSSATVNLNAGGTISISDSNLAPEKNGIVAGAGDYNFNLNGGTLRVNSCEYCDDKLTTSVNMNVLSESFLEADTADKRMLLNGNLVGDGGLVKTGEGTVIFSGENHYTGGTRVEAGELRANSAGAFVDNTTYIVNGGLLNLNNHDLIMSSLSGAGGVVDVTPANLTINQNNDSYFAGQFAGSGTITKSGTAQLALSGDSSGYSGLTTVSSGNLDSTNALGGQIVVEQGALLSATGYLGETTVTSGANMMVGSLYHANQPALSTLNIDTNLNNQGNVYVSRANNSDPSLVGNKLVVKGNYQGGGALHFNTVVGDDNSVTDHMTVTGDTSGETKVYVTNVGGMGAYTEKGIELIQVTGQSDGDFQQGGRITAGGYDYFLNRGNSEKGADEKNWYLTNYQPSPTPTPEEPTPEPEPTIRPEAGGYIHNIAASNMLFVHRLHDRLGETYYTDALTGEEKVTSMWMRNVGGHTRSRDSSGQLRTQTNRYILHIGGDVAQWSSDGQDRWHLGVMGAYANSHSNTRSAVTHYGADSSVDGYSLGGYATWQQNKGENTGAYVDTWALYSWFDNEVKGHQLATESYKSKGVTASIETGYTFKTGEYKDSKDETNEWFVQPQAQIVWMGVKADSFKEANGTRIHSNGDGNIQTRLGVRTFVKGHHQSDKGKGREFEPFIEANWIHNTKKFSTEMGNKRIKQAGTDNIGELKLGVEGQINPNFNLWGNVGVQVGDSGYSDAAFTLGFKYNFGQASKR